MARKKNKVYVEPVQEAHFFHKQQRWYVCQQIGSVLYQMGYSVAELKTLESRLRDPTSDTQALLTKIILQ